MNAAFRFLVLGFLAFGVGCTKSKPGTAELEKAKAEGFSFFLWRDKSDPRSEVEKSGNQISVTLRYSRLQNAGDGKVLVVAALPLGGERISKTSLETHID